MSHLTGSRYSHRGVILQAKPYGTMRYGGKATSVVCNASYTSRKQMQKIFSRRGRTACKSKQKIISVVIASRLQQQCDEQKQTRLKQGTEQ